jgi:hypothetical protein
MRVASWQLAMTRPSTTTLVLGLGLRTTNSNTRSAESTTGRIVSV